MSIAINPYVVFNGNCEEAVNFWATALGAKVEIMRMGDSPIPMPPESRDLVMHATVSGDGFVIMAADSMPGSSVEPGAQVAINVSFRTPEEQSGVWGRLAEGATVTMPLSEHALGSFGALTDKFGIRWMLNCEP